GIINGVTTNPTLLKKAGAKSWKEAKAMLTAILRLMKPNPVSLELTETTIAEMVDQAQELYALGAENAVIKVAIGGYPALDPAKDPFTGLKVLRKLWERDIRTNATLIFNSTQAFWAANAGATYVSPFMGRLADYMYKNDQPELPAGNSLYWIIDHKNSQGDQRTHNSEYVAVGGARKDSGIRLIREIAAIFANYDIHSEILAASVRNASQLTEVFLAGADIVTVPAQILRTVADHPLSDAGMVSFDNDAKVFSG
ncbi:MAG: transaldolase family protein, partial [Candidatus Glassbacteria bacterium]